MRLATVLLVLLGAAAGCSRAKKDPGGVCSSGETQACYEGPAGTLGVGTCAAGLSTCTAIGEWGACAGQVGPQADVCGNALDEDCNAVPDDAADPSAFDFPGNGSDDDCNGALDDAPTCDGGLASNSTAPGDFAKAIDVCALSTTAATTGFGVVRAGFALADGTGSPAVAQRSIRPAFGNVAPARGTGMTVLSTGVAAATGQTNPAYAAPVPGTSHATTSSYPADWYAANGNTVPAPPSCPAPAAGVIDPVLYSLELRVPNNAHAVAFDAFFLSADYPEFVCSSFTDIFVALLDSGYAGANPNPADKNIARTTIPVSVSCASAGACPFDACRNGATGCGTSGVAGNYGGCAETSSLTGTGFEVVDNQCETGGLVGGGTGFFTSAGNVVPGEVITLRFALWDTGDGTLDSHVLLDNVRWLPATITPGIQ